MYKLKEVGCAADGRFANPWELLLLRHIIATVKLKSKDRLSSRNNDSSDHSNHDVINLTDIAVGGVTNGV